MEGMGEWSSSRLQMFITLEMYSFKVYVLIFGKCFFVVLLITGGVFQLSGHYWIFRSKFMGWSWEIS